MINDSDRKDAQAEKQNEDDLLNQALRERVDKQDAENISEKLKDTTTIRENLGNAASRREHGDT